MNLQPIRPTLLLLTTLLTLGLASISTSAPPPSTAPITFTIGGPDGNSITLNGSFTLNLTTAPSTNPTTAQSLSNTIQSILQPGALDNDVLTISYPRTDLHVSNELGDIPTQAGLTSEFHFFYCTCGKAKVVGQFCLADYEANDVMDELRAGQLTVTSVSPMLAGEKPRITLVRFQGEGQPQAVAQTIKNAFKWIGENRMPAVKLNPNNN